MGKRMLVILFKTDLRAYVRTTQRQMHVDPAYQRYQMAKQQMAASARYAMLESGMDQMYPRVPLRLALFLCVPQSVGHKRDISNVLKGVEDGIQHVVYENDSWIDQVVVTRTIGKEHRAVAVLEPVQDGPPDFATWIVQAQGAATKRGVLTF